MYTGRDIAMALRRAYRAIHRHADATCRGTGVTVDQFVLLWLLAQKDQVTQRELVQRASSDANTVRAMLVRMERQHLVSRDAHPIDGRAHSVRLTDKGRKTLERLRAASEPLNEELTNSFSQQQISRLVAAL